MVNTSSNTAVSQFDAILFGLTRSETRRRETRSRGNIRRSIRNAKR